MSHSFTRGQSISFTYLGLTDAPGSFVGDALKILRVNAGESAIEHVTLNTTIVPEGSNLYFTDERVDDRVAALIQNGTGLTWTYVDGSNTLTGNVSLSSFSTTNLAEGTNLYFTNERAQDAVGNILTDSSSIDFTYNDGANTITAAVIDNTSIQKVEVVKNSGAVIATRKQLNFIEGTNISLTIADDIGNDQVDITITSTGVTTHALLSASHTDTTPAAVQRGDLITGQGASPTWSRLAKGSANQIFQSDGTDIGWVTIGGDATLSAGTLTIANDAVTFAKFQNITDNRLLGRSAGSSGDMMEITVSTGLSLAAGVLTSTITQYTDEMAQDTIATLIQNGTGISWSYNDGANTLTPTVTLAPFSTTNLAEGSNLYFTDERAQDAVGTILTDSASIDFTYNDGANTITAVVLPAGSNTQVQFNDSGVLGADADFTWNKTSNTLTVGAGSTGIALVKQYVQTAYILTTDTNYNILFSDTYPSGIQESVILGYSAFGNASGNSQGVGIGHFAGYNLRGISIIAIGYAAGQPNGPVTATGTVVIGDYSGARLGGGLYNTGVGHYSMAGNNSGTVLIGDYNTSIGYEAGRFMGNDANYNIAIGWQAGYQLGYLNDENIAIGTKSLWTEGPSNGAAQRNIAIGGYSLYLQDGGGGHNVAIGWEAGYNNIGSGNVFLGYRAGKAETTTDDTLIIANNDTTNLIRGDFSTGDVSIERSIQLTLGSDDEGDIYYRDSTGFFQRLAAGASGYVLTSSGPSSAPAWSPAPAGYSDEQAQDAVGTILVDSSTIDFTYNDGLPSITAIVIDDSITFAKIQNITDNRLLGRSAGSSGDMMEITVSTGLSLAAGVLTSTITQYTDEMAQDTVGGALTDSSTIDFTYNDGANTITASVIEAGLTLDNIGGILSLSKGGTSKNITASAGAVVWTDSDSMELTAVGTTGRALISGGTGSPTWFAPTAGSIIFAGTSGILQQDNANFFWDDSNNRLGVGTTTPSATITGYANAASDVKVRVQNDHTGGSATFSIYEPSLGSSTGFVNYTLQGATVAGTTNGINNAGMHLITAGADVYNFVTSVGASNTWNLFIGGSSIIRANTSLGGEVGIGGVANNNNRLGVSGSATVGSGYMSNIAPTNGMLIEGNVAIGTTSEAGNNLRIYNTTTLTKLMVENDNNAGTANITIYNPAAGSGTAYSSYLINGGTVAGNYITGVPNANLVGLITGASVDNLIIATTDGNLILATSNTATPVERLRFASTGQPTWTLGSDATGDVWYRDASGYFTRLGIGSGGEVLTVVAGLPSWEPSTGGTTSPLTTKGDLWGYDTADARVPVGANGYVLTADSGDPLGISWQPAAAGGSSTYRDSTPDNGTYGLLSGSVNGSNTTFTVSQGAYETGTLLVYKGGQLMTQGPANDWEETVPASGTFDFVVAPLTGEVITVEYALAMGGTPSPLYSVSSVSTDTTVTATSGEHIILVDTSSATVTITLPDASTTTCRYIIKKIHASNTLVIDTAGGDIEQAASATLYSYGETVEVITDNTDYWIY